MAADMLAAYYDRSIDIDALFRNLKIGRSETYKKHRNQYDVIKINMQEFLSATSGIDEMLRMLNDYLIFDLREQYSQVRFRDEKNLVQVMKDLTYDNEKEKDWLTVNPFKDEDSGIHNISINANDKKNENSAPRTARVIVTTDVEGIGPFEIPVMQEGKPEFLSTLEEDCLLYTSDAADE